MTIIPPYARKKNKNFIRTIRPTKNRDVKEYVLLIKVIGEVTVKCKIEDNDGKLHSIIIHNMNGVPEDPICLLSPQKWRQQEAGNHMRPNEICCTTKAKH